jgi:hypothetical protein
MRILLISLMICFKYVELISLPLLRSCIVSVHVIYSQSCVTQTPDPCIRLETQLSVLGNSTNAKIGTNSVAMLPITRLITRKNMALGGVVVETVWYLLLI